MRAQIDVSNNQFDQASSLELIAAMKGKSMVTIGMAGCKLGVEGAKAMAEMASVMASLTSVRASPELQPTGPALTHFFLACTDRCWLQ